jgi:hypothetical protein
MQMNHYIQQAEQQGVKGAVGSTLHILKNIVGAGAAAEDERDHEVRIANGFNNIQQAHQLEI